MALMTRHFYSSKLAAGLIASTLISACASTPKPATSTGPAPIAQPSLPHTKMSLIDRSSFHQQDPRWSAVTLGGSGEPLESDGCLVTAAAMAMSNLGFQTNPGDLATRLKSVDGFTNQGWLVWSGIEKVSGGIASTRFYNNDGAPSQTNAQTRACLADGFYPLVRFTLPSRSQHWAMVVAETSNGFYMRDPMVNSKLPIPLKSRASEIEAVRCIGVINQT